MTAPLFDDVVCAFVVAIADSERGMIVEFLRAAAQGLPDEERFPPNLTGLVVDLLFDLSDAIENREHHDVDETNETETLQ
jgi:hypothetical protein